MNRCHRKSLLAISLIAPLLLSSSAYAKIVCWTNSDNIRECGNAVPPEYAQKKTETLNERGMTTEVNERAKTPEEIAAEKVRLAEEQRLIDEEAQREKDRRTYDRVLLSTYLTESDIIRSRDRQTTSIDASIEVTNITIDKLNEKLVEEKKKAANYERAGKPLPERMQQDISSLQEQIDGKNRFIETKKAEKQKLYDKYQAEIIRFRELKADGVKLR